MWSLTVNRSGRDALTVTGDERIEARLGDIVDGIVEGIVAAVYPMAVFATGSLAKGELTARIADGRVELISDLEIAVVDINWLKRRAVRRVERDLARRWGVDLNLLFFLPRRFTRCAPANWAPARSRLNIEQFELIRTARCLHGWDLRQVAPPVRAEDIPVWEGVRLLFNRMAELAGELCRTGGPEPGALGKAVDKLLIACGDAMLLADGGYEPLYRTRMAALAERFANGGACSRGLAPDQCEAILGAYRAKLHGPERTPREITGSIAPALDISDRVFRGVLGGEMGMTLDDPTAVGAKYLSYPGLVRCGRTSARLANFVGLLKHLRRRRPLPVPLGRYFGRTHIGHEVYVAIYEWLYGEFRPRWQGADGGVPDDEELLERGRACVGRWRTVCM